MRHTTQANYIGYTTQSFNVGLIAEEVQKVYPELTVYKDDQIEGVRYHDLPMMMLNEQQKDHEKLNQAYEIISTLEQRIAELETKIQLLVKA